MSSSSIIDERHTLNTSLQHVLEHTATKGSWYGGGSAAALTCAVSAALVEKLARRRQTIAAARGIRLRCARLMDEDAQAFACVIRALAERPRLFPSRLKSAIEIPAQVHDDAHLVLRLVRQTKQTIPPRYHVDLQCAEAIAIAAAQSAQALIKTNLAWLNEPAYAKRMRRRLASAKPRLRSGEARLASRS